MNTFTERGAREEGGERRRERGGERKGRERGGREGGGARERGRHNSSSSFDMTSQLMLGT